VLGLHVIGKRLPPSWINNCANVLQLDCQAADPDVLKSPRQASQLTPATAPDLSVSLAQF
jgi:hypothetical protein